MTVYDVLGILLSLCFCGIGLFCMIAMIINSISYLNIKRKLFKLRKEKPTEYFNLIKLQLNKEKNNKRSDYIHKRRLQAKINCADFMISGYPKNIQKQVEQRVDKLREYKYMWWALDKMNETNCKTIDKKLEKKIEHNNLGDIETVKRILS